MEHNLKSGCWILPNLKIGCWISDPPFQGPKFYICIKYTYTCLFNSRLTSDRNIKFNDITVRSQSIPLCTKKYIIVTLIWILYYESINIQLKGSPFLDVIACHMFARIFHTYYGFIFYRHSLYHHDIGLRFLI